MAVVIPLLKHSPVWVPVMSEDLMKNNWRKTTLILTDQINTWTSIIDKTMVQFEKTPFILEEDAGGKERKLYVFGFF